MHKISPLYLMNLVKNIEEVLWQKFETSRYENVKYYIQHWQEVIDERNNFSPYNFNIYYKDKEEHQIALTKTLHNINDSELLFKIAVDLGLELPDVIYAVPEIKGILADKYETASDIFNKAYENIYHDPDTSILMANSALESIIKKICNDGHVTNCNNKKTLYDLTIHILKEFNFFPKEDLDKSIKSVGSSLLKCCQTIEHIRSDNTKGHGKTDYDYMVDDPLYAKFIINIISSIGLFLINFYEKKFLPDIKHVAIQDEDELPF